MLLELRFSVGVELLLKIIFLFVEFIISVWELLLLFVIVILSLLKVLWFVGNGLFICVNFMVVGCFELLWIVVFFKIGEMNAFLFLKFK